jgi:hypothetical protein
MQYAMSRPERLERWATVLEESPRPSLNPFRDVEFFAPSVRAGFRVPNSPLALAYQDPVLRRAGLASDRFGDGAEFFGLSPYQAHRVLCSCGYFGRMMPTEVARRVRGIVAGGRLHGWRPANPLPALARWVAGWGGQRGVAA